MTQDPELSPTLGWELTQPILEEGLLMLMKGLGNGCKEGVCVRGQMLPHIGGEQKGRPRGLENTGNQPWTGFHSWWSEP